VNPRAAPKRIGTCLSPPPLLFLAVRVPREPGRRVREAVVRKEGTREARVRTSGITRNREADENSRGKGDGVGEMRC
jgi:hypothetical protein